MWLICRIDGYFILLFWFADLVLDIESGQVTDSHQNLLSWKYRDKKEKEKKERKKKSEKEKERMKVRMNKERMKRIILYYSQLH